MKKSLAVLFMLVMIPTASFSSGVDFQLGATAFYNNLIYDTTSVTDIQYSFISDFTFGIDARLNLGIFQISGFALYTPGYEDAYYPMPHMLELFLDVGLKIDIFFMSLGAGIGPNFVFNFYPASIAAVSADDIFSAGANIKFFVDFNIGRWTVGLTYLMYVNITDWANITDAAAQTAQALDLMEGYLGISVLYKF